MTVQEAEAIMKIQMCAECETYNNGRECSGTCLTKDVIDALNGNNKLSDFEFWIIRLIQSMLINTNYTSTKKISKKALTDLFNKHEFEFEESEINEDFIKGANWVTTIIEKEIYNKMQEAEKTTI